MTRPATVTKVVRGTLNAAVAGHAVPVLAIAWAISTSCRAPSSCVYTIGVVGPGFRAES